MVLIHPGTAVAEGTVGTDGADIFDLAGGDDAASGGRNYNILFGDSDADFMIGGMGSDTIVFYPGDDNDTVTDFTDGEDLIDLSNFTGITGFGGLAVTQDNNNVVIDLSSHDGGTITLENVNLGDLDATDVTFLRAAGRGGGNLNEGTRETVPAGQRHIAWPVGHLSRRRARAQSCRRVTRAHGADRPSSPEFGRAAHDTNPHKSEPLAKLLSSRSARPACGPWPRLTVFPGARFRRCSAWRPR